MGSASWKYLWSSAWQKYSERNNSWVQMIFAPCFAASSASARVFLRLAAGSGEQEDCSRPSLTVPEEERFMADQDLPRVLVRVRVLWPSTVVPPLTFVLADRGTAWSNSSRMNLPSVSLVGP